MKKTHKQLLIGIVVSALFLWLAFRRVPLGELWAFLKTINYLWSAPLFFMLIFSMYWRAIRWRLLLPPSRGIPSSRLFGPLIIGFGLNNVFPARAGEFLRPLALMKQDGVPFGEGMGTVVMERIFDGIMLILLFFVVLVFVPFSGITQTWDARKSLTGEQLNLGLAGGAVVLAALAAWGWRWSRRTAGAGASSIAPSRASRICLGMSVVLLAIGAVVLLSRPFAPGHVYTFGQEYELSSDALKGLTRKTAVFVAVLLAGVIALLFKPFRDLILAIIHRMTWLPSGLRALMVRLMETFVSGLDSIRSPVRIFWILLHSMGVWLTVSVAFWLASLGIPGLHLTLMQANAFLVLTCVAIMIPAAPGYWGLYEVGGTFALLAMNVTDDASAALGFTLVVHFVQWVPITALGLYYAAKIHVSPGEAVKDEPATPREDLPPSPAKEKPGK